ncbi:MAG: phosphoglycerate kinase [Egibacteraceae bacterium]
MIDNLLGRVDRLLVGGAMCFTFLAANGGRVGASRVEQDQLDTVARLIRRAADGGVALLLPVDVVVAEAFAGARRASRARSPLVLGSP